MKNLLKISVFILSLLPFGFTAKVHTEPEICPELELSHRNEIISFLEKGNRFANFSAEETIESIQRFEHFQLNGKEACDKLCTLTLNYFFDVIQKKHSRDSEVETVLAEAFIDHQQFAQPFLSLMYSYVSPDHKVYYLLSNIIKKHPELKYGRVIEKEEKELWQIPCSLNTLEVTKILQNAYDAQNNLKDIPFVEGMHQARCLKNIYIIEALASQERAQKFVNSLFLGKQELLLKAVSTQMILSPSAKQKLSNMHEENFKEVNGTWSKTKFTLSRWAAKTYFENGTLLSIITFLGSASFIRSAYLFNDSFSIGDYNNPSFNILNFGAWFSNFIAEKIGMRAAKRVTIGVALLIPTSVLIFLQHLAVRSCSKQVALYI